MSAISAIIVVFQPLLCQVQVMSDRFYYFWKCTFSPWIFDNWSHVKYPWDTSLNVIPSTSFSIIKLNLQFLHACFVCFFSPRNFTVVNSKIIVVTIRPEPKTTDSFLEIELAHLSNVSTKIVDIIFYECYQVIWKKGVG